MLLLHLWVAVLAEMKADGIAHQLQISSRTMKSAAKEYFTCERAALGLVTALKKLRVYSLSYILTTVLTDHDALHYTFQEKDGHGRLAMAELFS